MKADINMLTFITMSLIGLVQILLMLISLMRPRLNPANAQAAQIDRSQNNPNRYMMFRAVIFFIVLSGLLALLYVEVTSPHELTRSSVYKIVFCVSGFFSVLLYETVRRAASSQARLIVSVAEMIHTSHPPIGQFEKLDRNLDY